MWSQVNLINKILPQPSTFKTNKNLRNKTNQVKKSKSKKNPTLPSER